MSVNRPIICPVLELVQNGRLLSLPIPAGDMHALLADEDTRRLYGAMKDQLLVTSLDDITHAPQQVKLPEACRNITDKCSDTLNINM